jgi:hypothetical protein|tara:strand:- start:743 stop:1078 length:336 start_codon:yes stop_codon:yes gene_type:complete
MDIEKELAWDIANLQITLSFCEKKKSISRLINANKIKDLTDRMLSSVFNYNQWVASLDNKTISDFDDIEVYKYFNIDRPYLDYVKDLESNYFNPIDKEIYKHFINKELARI